MTTAQAVSLFSILQDKYGSPNLENSEVVDMLNMATYEWLNRLVPSSLGGVVNYEIDASTLSAIKPLVFAITANMNGSGILTNAAITTALQTAGAEAGATWFRIGKAGITISGVTYPVKFSLHNDDFANERNFFKKASPTRVRYTIRQDGLKFNTIDAVNTLSFMIVKHPKLLVYGSVDPELDNAQMYNIIAIALKLAGVSTRDEELIMDVRNTALQTLQ